MDKKEVTCPACGSTSVEAHEKMNIISEPYSKPLHIRTIEYTCSVCGMTGDFVGDNDQTIENALEEAKQNAVTCIIDDFTHTNISMSAIERALELPQRTLTKWKNKLSSPSASGIALMNVIRTYPWILEVAQSKFDPEVARRVHIRNAIDDLLRISSSTQEDTLVEKGIVATTKSLVMYMRISQKDQDIHPESSRKEHYSVKDISFAEVAQ